MDLSKLLDGYLYVFIWTCQKWYMDLYKLSTSICQNWYMIYLRCYIDFSKLLHGFVKLVTCFTRPSPNKHSLSLTNVLKLIHWIKNLNEVLIAQYVTLYNHHIILYNHHIILYCNTLHYITNRLFRQLYRPAWPLPPLPFLCHLTQGWMYVWFG